jgi:5-methylcytosine-specific restriction endonuclease McrA
MFFCSRCGDLAESLDYCVRCQLRDDEVGVAPPLAQGSPRERSLLVEVFGVARRPEDGAPTQYFRRIASPERLAALRSMPYADYLETPEWWLVRECALDAAGFRCEVCNTDADLNVHHRTYRRRGEELLEDVTVLCRGCHQRFHDASELASDSGTSPPLRRVRMQLPERPSPEMLRFFAAFGA